MIRLTTENGGAVVKVAGDLVGEWAVLLERECGPRLDTGRELSLDLSDVKLVDDAGVASLRGLRMRGARVTRCPRVISDLIGGCAP
jgi:anti-anti-sigma regulatory factor